MHLTQGRRYKVVNMDNEKILDVKNLKTYFYMTDGVVKAVDDVSFSLNKGQTLGIVGESGCGKSVTSLSVMRLIQQPPGKIVEGEIKYHGKDLLKMPMRQIRKIRGANISMIFQEPMTSLNPVFQVGDQIAETLKLHQGLKSYSWRDWFTKTRKIDTPAWRRAIEMLKLVGIPDAERRVLSYPHEMSGGMRQRVMIAMAMACNPEILIADEATTALDVTIQAQILELMKDLRRRFGMAIILITHNLAVVAEMVDEIAVMYSGKIVEYADAKKIFYTPRHPYTWGLLHSIPRVDQKKTDEKLPTIEGMVPSPFNLPVGCKFHPRCFNAGQKCREEEPPLRTLEDGRQLRCWFPITKEGAE